MATDLEFPIELRMSAGNKFLLLAIGCFLIGYGAYVVGGQSMIPVPVFGEIPVATFGYIAAAVGISVAIASVKALVGERPKLVLDAEGLVFTPTFGAARRLAWAEIAALTPYSNRYDTGVEIRTRVGERMKIPALEGSAKDMHDLMLHCVVVNARGVARASSG